MATGEDEMLGRGCGNAQQHLTAAPLGEQSWAASGEDERPGGAVGATPNTTLCDASQGAIRGGKWRVRGLGGCRAHAL